MSRFSLLLPVWKRFGQNHIRIFLEQPARSKRVAEERPGFDNVANVAELSRQRVFFAVTVWRRSFGASVHHANAQRSVVLGSSTACWKFYSQNPPKPPSAL